MKTFAVAFWSMHSNELTLEIIQADTWQNAARAHSKSVLNDEYFDDSVLSTVEDAKRNAFDADGGFDIIELSAGPGDCQINGHSPEQSLFGLIFPGMSDPKKPLPDLGDEPESAFGIPKPAKG